MVLMNEIRYRVAIKGRKLYLRKFSPREPLYIDAPEEDLTNDPQKAHEFWTRREAAEWQEVGPFRGEEIEVEKIERLIDADRWYAKRELARQDQDAAEQREDG